MILRECVEAKYAAQEKHFKQTRGSLAAYSKLLMRKYQEMQKRREVKTGVPDGFVAVNAK
jgi:hypothetical protein